MESDLHEYASWQAALPWVLSIGVGLVAILVWGSSLGWHFSGLSIYQIFPIFGLLAFSTLWSQYMTGFLQHNILKGVKIGPYYKWTGVVVLAAILLHPGLLSYQRLRDGFGLPPGSDLSYVAHSLAWVVILGIISLLIFLSFELHRWFSHKKWWFIIARLCDLAMVAIFYHALRLGTQTHISWFRVVWWFYGICLIMVLAYNYSLLLRKHRSA